MRRVVPLTVAGLLLVSLSSALAAPKPPARPSFTSYASPSGMGDDAGEPTLGFEPRSGTVLFQSGSRTLRASGFGPRGIATWQDVSPLVPGLYTFDPILKTDARTGRTWSSQLDLYCSRMAFTDNAGMTWTQVKVGCAPGATFDHQTVGVGPFRVEGPKPTSTYPNVVYYCAQTGATANCGTSFDGGESFGPATVAYSVADCTTAFGHLETAPDGMAYLPPWECGDQMGLAVSDDNGGSWEVRRIPWTVAGDAMHPSVDVASDGTLYFGYGGDVHGGPGLNAPYAVVSRDEGDSWLRPVRLGAEHRIVNTRFVTVVAGDGDRAAISYLGTPTAGDGSLATFAGTWHLYVSFTYDRGRTWTTVRATDHPVQVGPISTAGALSQDPRTRNLLDFIDSVVDARGRVLVAVADGCPGAAACTTADRGSKATIVRQATGRGLLRRFD